MLPAPQDQEKARILTLNIVLTLNVVLEILDSAIKQENEIKGS